MTHLLEIGLSNNEMEEFSLQAPKLRHLSLRSNQFRKPPECLGDLASLTSLDISANPLTSFPPSLAFLESLVALDISQIPLDTQIPSLQTSVFRLVALKSLSMSSCFLQSVALPPLKNLENLVSLNLNNNHLEEVPSHLLLLTKLQNLLLSGNELRHLPDTISYLEDLRYLDISNNMITDFPKSLKKMQGLKYGTFLLNDNPLSAKYKTNGIYPTPQLVFDYLESDISGEYPNKNILGSEGSTQVIPIISVFFVGPSSAGKRDIVRAFFPESLNETAEPPIGLPTTVSILPVIEREVDETPYRVRLRIFAGQGKLFSFK